VAFIGERGDDSRVVLAQQGSQLVVCAGAVPDGVLLGTGVGIGRLGGVAGLDGVGLGGDLGGRFEGARVVDGQRLLDSRVVKDGHVGGTVTVTAGSWIVGRSTAPTGLQVPRCGVHSGSIARGVRGFRLLSGVPARGRAADHYRRICRILSAFSTRGRRQRRQTSPWLDGVSSGRSSSRAAALFSCGYR
jgi:hypothetical protein